MGEATGGAGAAGDRSGRDQPAATYRQDNQAGVGGVVYAVQHGNQHVYAGEPPYRVRAFPLTAAPLPAGRVARSPSRLLAARHQVVPFTGRAVELGWLAGWRDDDQAGMAAGVSVRLLHGPGGQGKTRLAARFAHDSAVAGWTVAAATHTSDLATHLAAGRSQGRDELRVTGRGLLLVVDYAERWPTGDLLRLFSDHLGAGGGPVRILLLARPAGSWWDGLAYQLDRADIIIDVDDLALPALADQPGDRAEVFAAAVAAFAPHLQVNDPEQVRPPAGLEQDPGYALALTVHMAALAAVDAHRHGTAPPDDAAAVSGYLLRREHSHWEALHTAGRITTGPQQIGRAVYTAALTRALPHDPAVAVLNRAGIASTPETAGQVLADHAVCYPPTSPGTWLEPLYPDRLAEDFLALTTPTPQPLPGGGQADPWAATAAAHLLTDARPDADHPSANRQDPRASDRGSGRDQARTPGYTRAAVTILIEASARWPHLATGVLYPLLTEQPELALAAGGAALTRLADLPDIDLDLLAAIEAHLPTGRHFDLDTGAATVTIRLTDHRLPLATDPAQQARLSTNLAQRLANAGLRDEALAPSRRAVEIYRSLADANPRSWESFLASSLTNLGTRLAELGDHQGALDATQEAVGIWRRQKVTRIWRSHKTNPAYQPERATSLTNLGRWLSEVGRRQEAVDVTQEAVKIWRKLAAAKPANHEPDLAATLTNLSIWMTGIGQYTEALRVSEEAIGIWRRLAEAKPATHEPDLAAALNNQTERLLNLNQDYRASDFGKKEKEALAKAEVPAREAVEIRRRLAKVNLAAFEPDLAASINNLAIIRALQGRWEEAIRLDTEALGIRRRLAKVNPAAFEPDLAGTLSNLGMDLYEVGRPKDALTETTKALEIRRRLAYADPAVHQPDLAKTLSSRSQILEELGRHQEAINDAVEGLELWRQLADKYPAAYGPIFDASQQYLFLLRSGLWT